MSLNSVVSGGDELETLRVLRDALAVKLDECDSMRDYAALSLRFMDVLVRISELEARVPEREGSALDDITARRKARGAVS